MTNGILIVNLGTPASPNTKDVRAYLNEFLMDPYVLDVPWPLRRMIVSGFILPFRPKQSAHAYQSIWTDDGSPLLIYGNALRTALEEQLETPVALGMRYGEPSVQSAISQLMQAGAERIVALPLYPQYADSTVTTTVEHIRQHTPASTPLEIMPIFYDKQPFIKALIEVTKAHLPTQMDHLLMSYHGLPERHLTKADPTKSHCLQREDCCQIESIAHSTCYRHQVFETSTALARGLGLSPEQYTVSFQSRLGRLPWLQPYTDQVLAELPERGCRHLAVVCPAFVADNLETLEEMNMQGRQTFLEAGGESFTLVPCLNDDAIWVEALAELLQAHMSTANSDTSA